MTKKESCIGRPIIACSSCFGGLVKFIFYGIDDYAYLVTGIWNGKKSYHRLKIYYGMKFCLHPPVRTAMSAFRVYTRLNLIRLAAVCGRRFWEAFLCQRQIHK